MAIYEQILKVDTHFTSPGPGVCSAGGFDAEIRAAVNADPGSWPIAFRGVSVVGNDVFVTWAAEPDQAQKDATVALAPLHSGEDPVAITEVFTFESSLLDSRGRLRSSAGLEEGSEKYFYTHNLCDPCAWYNNGIQVSEQELTPDANGREWDGPDKYWIDLKHGRVFKEDNIENVSTFYPKIEISTDDGDSWDELQEQTWGKNDGDYRINYEEGIVVLFASNPTARVRATYYKAGSSEYVVQPAAGKKLLLQYVEVQYTEDIEMHTDVVFEIRIYAAALAAILQSSLDPGEQAQGAALQGAIDLFGVDPGNPMAVNPLSKMGVVSERYKKLIDFYQESTGPYPTVPAHGGKNRGISHRLLTIPFNYLSAREIKSSAGMEVAVSCGENIPISGEFSSVTFYCKSEKE